MTEPDYIEFLGIALGELKPVALSMGTLNAIYVRAGETEKAAVVQVDYPTAFTESGLEFWAVERPPLDFTPPEAELAALSARLRTDVLWLGFQSVSDAFQFHHWRSGVHTRVLVYGCFEQGLWERVEGGPESWERAAFFDPKDLTRLLKDAEQDEAIEFERMWQDAAVVAGRIYPMIDARESARSVAEYYRLPGWS